MLVVFVFGEGPGFEVCQGVWVWGVGVSGGGVAGGVVVGVGVGVVSQEGSVSEALGTDTRLLLHPTDDIPDRPGQRYKRRYDLQETARKLLPGYRIRVCGLVATEPGKTIKLFRGSSTAWFSGLMHCSSVWHCPVCSAKISDHRQKEIQKGLDYAIHQGMGAVLITTTFRHGIDDPLPDTLGKFAIALRRMKSGKGYKTICQRFGLDGEIRALEVTHGHNGWHPHTHAITFSKKPITGHDLTRLKRVLFARWYAICQKVGLPLPTYKNGIDVRGAKYAAEYVVKFGFAAELSKANQKKARRGGRNPWQLLEDAHNGDGRAAWLFREYAQHFKGKRQIFWSRGLRDRLAVDAECTDQEAMDFEPEEKQLVAEFSIHTWRAIVKARCIGQLVALALDENDQGRNALLGYVEHIRQTVSIFINKTMGYQTAAELDGMWEFRDVR